MKEIKNEYAVRNILESFDNAQKFAEYLSTDSEKVKNEIIRAENRLYMFLINHSIIPHIIKELCHYAEELGHALSSIGDEYENLAHIIRAFELRVWEHDEKLNLIYFNSCDGLYSGVIGYNARDDYFYLVNDMWQIWDDGTKDWRWRYDVDKDEVTEIGK
jgi:hypothetical protein